MEDIPLEEVTDTNKEVKSSPGKEGREQGVEASARSTRFPSVQIISHKSSSHTASPNNALDSSDEESPVADDTHLVNILSLNCWLIPFGAEFPFLDTGVKSRAKNVATYIQNNHNEVDIILLQEVWSSNTKISTLSCLNCLCCFSIMGRPQIEDALTNFHISREPNPLFCGGIMKFMDCGLITASKHPIVKKKFVQFIAHADEDMLARKGVLFSHTNDIIVINTHLNAKKQHHKCRKEQIEELLVGLKRFIEECKAEGLSTDKIIASGDWNIDGSAAGFDAEEYEQAVTRMKSVGLHDVWAGQKWDQKRKDLSHYQEIGATSLDSPNGSIVPMRLDMIFTNGTSKGIKPLWKKAQTRQSVPKLFVAHDAERVSDHAPVRAAISFPAKSGGGPNISLLAPLVDMSMVSHKPGSSAVKEEETREGRTMVDDTALLNA